MTIFSALLLVGFSFGRSLVAVVDAQLGNESTRISLGSVACAELNGARLTAVTCNNNFDAAASFPPTGTSLGMGTAASGFATFASGLLSQATGDVATAIGFNVTAGGNSSVAFGVDTRTVSDDGAYADGTCGGCFVTGKLSTAVGDWCVATGYNTLARGYASSAFGEGTVASSWGEVALGLYNEIDFGRTEAQLGSASVIPTFNESDVALRVGIGCDPNPMYGGIGCPERRRLDALRVYKSGRLATTSQRFSGCVARLLARSRLRRRATSPFGVLFPVIIALLAPIRFGLEKSTGRFPRRGSSRTDLGTDPWSAPAVLRRC